MTAVTGTKPHPIFLAGRWVESPDPLVVANPADDSTPAGSTFNATPEQYEEAVQAAVAAFEVTRELPAYERGRILREISAGVRAKDGFSVVAPISVTVPSSTSCRRPSC